MLDSPILEWFLFGFMLKHKHRVCVPLTMTTHTIHWCWNWATWEKRILSYSIRTKIFSFTLFVAWIYDLEKYFLQMHEIGQSPCQACGIWMPHGLIYQAWNVICACYLPLFGENNIRCKIEIFMCQPKNELNASLWRHNIWAHILNAWNRNELFAPVINCVQFYHVS